MSNLFAKSAPGWIHPQKRRKISREPSSAHSMLPNFPSKGASLGAKDRNYLYYTKFPPGALNGVTVYVHPRMENLANTLDTLKTAGAQLVPFDQTSPPHLHGAENYLLLPFVTDKDISSCISKHRSNPSTWPTPASPTFLDMRLVVPSARPAQNPFYTPLSIPLPLPNFPHQYVSVMGKESGLLMAYRYFCEAVRKGPDVYAEERHFTSTHKPRNDRVTLVVLVRNSSGDYLDFARDTFWHLPPAKNESGTLFQDLQYLANRQIPPLFVKDEWLKAVAREQAGRGRVPPALPYKFKAIEIREAIDKYQTRLRHLHHQRPGDSYIPYSGSPPSRSRTPPSRRYSPVSRSSSPPAHRRQRADQWARTVAAEEMEEGEIEHSSDESERSGPALKRRRQMTGETSEGERRGPPAQQVRKEGQIDHLTTGSERPAAASAQQRTVVGLAAERSEEDGEIDELDKKGVITDGATRPSAAPVEGQGEVDQGTEAENADEDGVEDMVGRADPADVDPPIAEPVDPGQCDWHHIEVILDPIMQVDEVLRMLQAEFATSAGQLRFIPAERSIPDLVDSTCRRMTVIRVSTTLPNGFRLTTESIMAAFPMLSELQVAVTIDGVEEIMQIPRT